jgi:AraC-like DNA-binding protein
MRITSTHTDSPFGCWTMSEVRPPKLAGAVERLWYSEGMLVSPRERIFPNGLLELIVHLGEEYRLVEGTGAFGTTCLSGLQSRPIVIDGPARHRVLGIRLRPAGARALLACPLSEVTDLSLDLEDALGRAAVELAERVAEARSVEERFRIAAGWVVERILRASSSVEEGVVWATAQIEKSGGAVAIADLREELGVSKARFVAAFREQVGVAPKLYARIIRFRRSLALLQGGSMSLVDVALASGYYDQPHMNAEFRALGGVTPSEFLAARYPSGDGSSAADVSP